MTHALMGDSVAIPRAEYDALSMVVHEAGMLAANAATGDDGRVYILPGELARLRQVMRDYYTSLRGRRGQVEAEQLKLMEVA